MTNLLSICKPYRDFGMAYDIMIPEQIYEDFSQAMNTIMMLLAMSEYKLKYSGNVRNCTLQHYFRFLLDNQRAFTILFSHNVDKYRSSLDVSISYHFHDNMSLFQKHKDLFRQLFDSVGSLNDNAVNFENAEDLVNGLKQFTKLL